MRCAGVVIAVWQLCSLLPLARDASAQLDPSGAWRTLHTPHFLIHFRTAYRAVAEQEAREAERAYALLASELRPPRGVVDVTLVDDLDAANGAAAVFPSSRVYVFLPPPAADPALQRYDSWLRLVTQHELTHIFHLDRVGGVWGAIQDVFGRVPGTFPNGYQPSWVTEGLATYYESKFTNGGRVRGSFHTEILAADAAAGASRSRADALLYTRWADGNVPYAYGSRFFHYLAGDGGDSVIARFVEATSHQLIPYRVGRQLGRAAPGREFTADWARGTRPEPAVGVAPQGRVIARGLYSEPVPQVSPDGRRVAYQHDDARGAPELRILDARDFRVLRRHLVNVEVSYDWLGDTLVVAQLDFTSRWRAHSDLYRWRPDGSWRRETHGARLVRPRGGGGRLAAIALAPASTRPTLPVPPGPEGATWAELVPSPDGRTVAATRNTDGRWALLRWPVDTPAAARALRESAGVLADPAWTQAGELLFVVDQDGFPQVFRWSDSTGATALTSEPLGARAPAALPDGSLLYVTLAADGWVLKQARPIAGRPPPLAADEPAPFDTAPAVPVFETGYSAWPSLKPHFWLPIGRAAGAAGRFFGALTASSDAVGRWAYYAAALVSRDPLRVGGAVGVLSNALGNPTVDASAASDWWLLGVTPGDTAVAELDQSAALGLTLLRRRWRSTLSLRLAGEYEGTRYAATPAGPVLASCPGCIDQDIVGGSATVSFARVVRPVRAVSAEDGFAWSATYRRREEQGTPRWSNEYRSRLALYAHLPGLGGYAHHVLALRLAAGATAGPLVKALDVGGVSAGAYDLGFGQSLGGERAFPVRGYGRRALRGRRAATASLEYRLPLALAGKSLGTLPVGADKLWLNVFADAGDAWDPGTAPRLTRLRSVGIELAGVLTENYDVRLALRLGVAEPLAAPPSGARRAPRVYVALGSDF